MEITVGEIQDKLDTQIFSEADPNPYLERERILKTYIDVVIKHCLQLVELKHEGDRKISHYKDFRIKRSLRRFCDYIAYLAEELDKDKIKTFCDKQKLFISNYDIDTSFIIANSYYGSIKYDLYWIYDLKYIDAFNIGVGKFKIEDLSKYLPTTFYKFEKEVIPYFKKQKRFTDYHSSLIEIQAAYKSKLYRSCNLLILVCVEGMVRKLGAFLIEKQNLQLSPKQEYNSLDSFLRNIPWKLDFEISSTEYKMITGDYDFRREGSSLDKIQIGLKDRLDFLRRRFKEDRDLILHGIESDFGKEWHLYINLKALENVFVTIAYYTEKYKGS